MEDEKQWDVTVDKGGLCIRANVKVFTTRDSLAKSRLERAIAEREGEDADDMEMLYLVGNFPLLRYGIQEAEGLTLPLTEEGFWALPEEAMLLLVDAIREVNPQFNVPFLDLQKMLLRMLPPDSESEGEPTSTPEATASPGSLNI